MFPREVDMFSRGQVCGFFARRREGPMQLILQLCQPPSDIRPPPATRRTDALGSARSPVGSRRGPGRAPSLGPPYAAVPGTPGAAPWRLPRWPISDGSIWSLRQTTPADPPRIDDLSRDRSRPLLSETAEIFM